MPIAVAPLNLPLRVIKLPAEEKIKKHLENLGITVGSEITVLSSVGGSIICKVKEGRLALDKNMGTKILIG